jgi:alpha-tubulin suppressor-like RCC1 family protein
LIGAVSGAAVAHAASGIEPVATTISAGYLHTCMIREPNSATLRCAGYNDLGQLGNAQTEPVQPNGEPNDVNGVGVGLRAVAAGAEHTCALGHAGVLCWGWNGLGQLGDGTYDDSLTPTAALVSPDVTGVVAGGDFTCAWTHAGGASCWGDNSMGQLGNGQAGCDRDDLEHCRSATPVAVSGLSGVQQLAASVTHTCALTTGGAVVCWPWLGKTRPTAVPGLGSGVKAISSGVGYTCALTVGGAVKCAGDNQYGQLGNGTSGNQSSTAVTAISKGVAAIGAGWYHACVITTKGGVACWGRNDDGEIGDGTKKERTRPVPVKGLGLGSDATEVVGGDGHTCVRLELNEIRCFGRNQFGELGNGRGGIGQASLTPVLSHFGGPIVRFAVHVNARRALKGGGHRFELTKIFGLGVLELERPPSGTRVAVTDGLGTLRVHRWKVFQHGSVDEENLDLKVVAPSGSLFAGGMGAVIEDLGVAVRASDPHETDSCPRGSSGTVTFVDSRFRDGDVVVIDTCRLEHKFVEGAHTTVVVAITG